MSATSFQVDENWVAVVLDGPIVAFIPNDPDAPQVWTYLAEDGASALVTQDQPAAIAATESAIEAKLLPKTYVDDAATAIATAAEFAKQTEVAQLQARIAQLQDG